MDSFTVKVDLSAFFDDERKMSVVLVGPECTTVECLQQKLQRLFDLSELQFTTDDDCFIPAQESVDILRQTSLVKAFLLKRNKERKIKRRKHLEEATDDLPIVYEKQENGSAVSSAKKTRKQKVISRNNGVEEIDESAKVDKAEEFEKLKQKPFAQFRCLLQNQCETKARVLKFVKNPTAVHEDELQLHGETENEIIKQNELDEPVEIATGSAIENDNCQLAKVVNKEQLEI